LTKAVIGFGLSHQHYYHVVTWMQINYWYYYDSRGVTLSSWLSFPENFSLEGRVQ